MKNLLLAVTLLVSSLLGGRELQAQAYGPYYYDPSWDAAQYQQYLEWQQYVQGLQQYDPYYELHVMHYQLYRQQFQPYQYSYQPCCYAWGGTIPGWSAQRSPIQPGVVIAPARVVGPLPPAVAPLPRAVAPLPRATGRR